MEYFVKKLLLMKEIFGGRGGKWEKEKGKRQKGNGKRQTGYVDEWLSD